LKFRTFSDAKTFVHSRSLKNRKEWREYLKSGKKPDDIPSDPLHSYKDNGWISWGDFLGTGTLPSQEIGWSIEKVKELLRDLIKSKVIYQWSEDARLYKVLLTKGVLNLKSENRHSNFFKNLQQTVKTEEGRKIIEEYAFSESKDIPNISNTYSENNDEEIPIASNEELINLVNDKEDPLDYKEPPTVEQILSTISMLESINVDEEAMQFFLRGSVNDFWKRAFKEEEKTVLSVQQEGKN
jgi:hypothetical protein